MALNTFWFLEVLNNHKIQILWNIPKLPIHNPNAKQ